MKVVGSCKQVHPQASYKEPHKVGYADPNIWKVRPTEAILGTCRHFELLWSCLKADVQHRFLYLLCLAFPNTA